ncbi:hypothetical protein [Halopseudomonas pelagia]|uniref:hypothetical protein n=1 Tax=Halopseudomonas pelagia TaxID=553151 RepID=UPI00117B3B85|nr:hypothetical protein [Halopseudomonas pelagia]
MRLIDSASAEFQRSPITVVTGAIGVLVAALSLILAAAQYKVTPEAIGQTRSDLTTQALEINLGNIFVIASYFLSSTIVSAIIIRKIARKHDVAALFASVPLAALVNFTAILLIYLAPPRTLSQQLFTSAHDLILYASGAIYISACGVAVLRDMASSTASKKSDEESKGGESSEGLGLLIVPLILLFIWCWLVFAGQTRITQTLLPEITHYIEREKPSDGS